MEFLIVYKFLIIKKYLKIKNTENGYILKKSRFYTKKQTGKINKLLAHEDFKLDVFVLRFSIILEKKKSFTKIKFIEYKKLKTFINGIINGDYPVIRPAQRIFVGDMPPPVGEIHRIMMEHIVDNTQDMDKETLSLLKERCNSGRKVIVKTDRLETGGFVERMEVEVDYGHLDIYSQRVKEKIENSSFLKRPPLSDFGKKLTDFDFRELAVKIFDKNLEDTENKSFPLVGKKINIYKKD